MLATKTKMKEIEYNKNSLCIVLVKDYTFSEMPIAGKKIIDWMMHACQSFDVIVSDCKDDYLDIAKNIETESQYMFVLPANCPLITKKDICEILDYMIYKEMPVVKLEHGYGFKTDGLKRLNKIYDLFTVPIARDRFFKVEDYSTLSIVTKQIRNKINEYHLRQGVRLIDPNTTYIDSNVVIGNGVTIAPCVSLTNQTVIGDHCYIGMNSIIDGSTILPFSVVHQSVLRHVLVKENSEIKPFTILENTQVGDDE